jgi:cold shock protein
VPKSLTRPGTEPRLRIKRHPNARVAADEDADVDGVIASRWHSRWSDPVALAVTDMRAAWFGTWCLHRNPIAVAVNARDPGVMARGTVKFFKADKGYGAIASPDLPDGLDAWVHFSAIEMDGYRFLEAGDQVEFGYEAAQQDSFRFVATWVRKL